MKNLTLTLNENQANALGCILRNAHHAPHLNDTLLPLSREIADLLDAAPEVMNKEDESLAPRIDMREGYAEVIASHPLWSQAAR